MSGIFDALQRSEGERSEGDGAEQSAGPELIRRVERRVLSNWAGDPPAQESAAGASEPSGRYAGPETAGSAAAAPSSADGRPWSAEARPALLSQLRSVPISLAPDSRLVCLTDRESPTAEAVRLLSVRLRDLRRVRPLKKVLVTSSIPREGKSTISANLACALANGGEEKALLIEGDVRLPALRQMFGIEAVPGVSELVHDGRSVTDCVHHLNEAGIWLLPAGRVPANPLETLQSQKLPAVMDQLAASFDWIIIDSPPVLPLADTSIWMRLADGILLVTRQGVTEKQQLQKGLEALEPAKVLGALLNSAVASAYSSYYYRSSERY